MSDELSDVQIADIHEYTVLAKFEGEPQPENLIEQIHIENGEIIKREVFEGGELVSSETVEGVE